MQERPGKLLVLSGPSGSGKSTILARALALGDLSVRLAVSATTRTPRPGEVDGVHYYFWTRPQFDEAIRNQEFLEWAEVHGNRYGTLKREVDPYLAQGVHVLLEIDVQGAEQVRRARPDCVTLFVRTSNWEEYERRLRARGTENEIELQRRLQGARVELARAADYDVQIINDDLEAAVQSLRRALQHYGGTNRAG